MRSTLFTIPLDGRIDLGPLGSWPVFGMGLLLLLWTALGVWGMYRVARQTGLKDFPFSTLFVWAIIATVIFELPRHIQAIPIFGYGTMLFLGFLFSAGVAARRLRNLGQDGEIAWDLAMWVFVAGILGARAFFVMQYPAKFFGPDMETGKARTVIETLLALIKLPDGGLVFYGGMIGSAVAFYLFCKLRRLNPLALGDIVITSIFIGMTFGRIGCLFNGCCYGDLCDLSWAVTFPHDSYPYVMEVKRGLITEASSRSLPVHPAQIYSAMNAAVLVLLTWAYYPYRRRDGEVLALGWLAYPVSRFVVEFLRGDEGGQFGTMLTISQWVSVGLFATGMVFFLLNKRRTTQA